jgi:tetratricopeptide (TPR) repeat protein
MSMGLYENSMESLNRVLVIDPENTESLLKLAELNLILRKYREAIDYSRQAIALDSRDPLPYFIMAYTFAEAGDTVQAIKNYLEVVNRDQDYYDAYIQLGLIYSTAGNDLAVDYFNNALNLDPNSIEALYALAMYYQQTENATNAIATYNKLLLIDPENVYANYNLGYVHLVLLNDFKQAIKYFTKAVELNPRYYEALYNLGYCYELTADYGRARELYNKTLEIEVNYDRAVEGLNRVYGK